MRQAGNDKALRNVVLALTAISLCIFAYKVLVLGFPLQEKRSAESWTVEARVAFTALGKPVKVTLQLPHDSPAFVVNDEAFVSNNYGMTINVAGGNRQAQWSVRKAQGQQVLYYRAVVRRTPAVASRGELPGAVVATPAFAGAELAAAKSLIDESRTQSADLETLVGQLLRKLGNRQDGKVRMLLGSNPTAQKQASIAAQLLTLAGYPTAVVHGIRLKRLERGATLAEWLRVRDGRRWRWFSAESGAEGLPQDFLPWWYGMAPLAKVSGANRTNTNLAVTANEETTLGGATERGRQTTPRLHALSLLSLPIETQLVYRVILLVPVGVFVLVLMRNVVGFKTFGTFMPVLIALAFRQTQLLWGVVLFSVLVALGLLVRFYFERLKLLLVPRLAAVLIVVVLLMASLSVVTHLWGLPQGFSVALFPMVILTMTIERMSIVWEERGGREAMQQGLGSMAVAALAYLVMNLDWLQHLVFVFPELLLLLLAGVILLGRYSGYRLTELRRFRALSKGSR
ncbi:MAG: inactive transglutaminase family protein [Acidihalobacter sp.]